MGCHSPQMQGGEGGSSPSTTKGVNCVKNGVFKTTVESL